MTQSEAEALRSGAMITAHLAEQPLPKSTSVGWASSKGTVLMSTWGQTALIHRLLALCSHTKEGKCRVVVVWGFGRPDPINQESDITN